MDNNLNELVITKFLESTIVKYSQGLIFWIEQSNNTDNTRERAIDCENNVRHFSSVYTELKELLESAKNQEYPQD